MSIPIPGASAPDSLVPVLQGEIGGVPMHVCDARTLHAFLESGDRFADWISARIEKFGDMHLIQADDLWPLTSTMANLAFALSMVMEAPNKEAAKAKKSKAGLVSFLTLQST
jgi:hypothetical protein